MNVSTFVRKYIDLKLVLLLAAFYSLFDLVYLSKIAYIRANLMEEHKETWPEILTYVLLDWFIVIAFMTFIAISTRRLLEKNYSWIKIFILHIIFSLFIGFVIRLVFDLHGILSGNFAMEEYSLRSSIDRLVLVMDFNFLIYFAMVFIVYTYYYLKQVKLAEKQRNQLESQLVNTRMKMLSSQLQPHFLFNTLNSIAVLVEMDAKKAQNTIADLSDFLREILYNSDKYKVPLEKELDILEHYLNIVTIRFSDHLEIRKEVQEGLMRMEVPALLLQPIIENSVKHGYSYNHTDLVIELHIYRENDELIIKVANNGEPLRQGQIDLLKKGVGLSNIQDRLINLYGKDAGLEIRNREGRSGVETIVRIPI